MIAFLFVLLANTIHIDWAQVVLNEYSCDTSQSCANQTISDNLIIFNAYKSGQNVDATANIGIRCWASKSCIESTLVGSSGFGGIASIGGDISIGGSFGAYDSEIRVSLDEDISVSAVYGAANSQISSTSGALDCSGRSSCFNSTISASLVNAYGAYSAANATITPTGTKNVNLLGYRSGYSSDKMCMQTVHPCTHIPNSASHRC